MHFIFRLCCCITGKMGKVFNHITSIVGAWFICGCLSNGRCTWRWIKAQIQNTKAPFPNTINTHFFFSIHPAIHPQGKIVEGPNLRLQLAELITATRQLYEDSCELLRERSQTLILREDLETKLSFALANTEMELRKCTVSKSADGQMRASLNVLAPNEEVKSNRITRFHSVRKWFYFKLLSKNQYRGFPDDGHAIKIKFSLKNKKQRIDYWCTLCCRV